MAPLTLILVPLVSVIAPAFWPIEFLATPPVEIKVPVIRSPVVLIVISPPGFISSPESVLSTPEVFTVPKLLKPADVTVNHHLGLLCLIHFLELPNHRR